MESVPVWMRPELLFTLRNVDQQDLITKASHGMVKFKTSKLLENENLSELFGIDIAESKRKRDKTADRNHSI